MSPSRAHGRAKGDSKDGPVTGKRLPGRPTAGNSPVSDADVLEVALLSFAERGYEGTSVRDLCRQVGVSHNLIHQRFGTKDELWYAAVDHGFNALTHNLMEAVLEVGEGDDLERLRAVLIRFVEVTAGSPALARVINQEGVTPSPRLTYIYRRHIGRAMTLMKDTLDRLVTDGRIREVPTSVFYFCVANGAAGPLTLPALAGCFPDAPAYEQRGDLRRYAELVVDVFLEGLVVR